MEVFYRALCGILLPAASSIFGIIQKVIECFHFPRRREVFPQGLTAENVSAGIRAACKNLWGVLKRNRDVCFHNQMVGARAGKYALTFRISAGGVM